MSQRETQTPDAFPAAGEIAEMLDQLREVDQPRYRRMWAYCRNPMRIVGRADNEGDRPYRQAQEWGLPPRITGNTCGTDVMSAQPSAGVVRKEVVIENDIGWRVETMVDYLFGRPLVIQSSAPDPDRRAVISELLRQILAHNGGILFLQQLALIGTVHGFVDVLVKFCGDRATEDAATIAGRVDSTPCNTQDLGRPPVGSSSHATVGPDGDGSSEGGAEREAGASAQAESASEKESRAAVGGGSDSVLVSPTPRAASSPSQQAESLARMVRLEIVEPARALPFLCPKDYRNVLAYGQVSETVRGERASIGETAIARRSWIDLFRRASARALLRHPESNSSVNIELITAHAWRRYENCKIAASGDNSLGRIPLVHIQNTAVPFSYTGVSDVEPLIPLQDELNTRLSDRANRITMQSFKMYLGKNIENFDKLPVAPGRMWMSDEKDADVIEFGGDASSPSEDAHLSDIREAIDKISGVTPIAAGAIKGRIGRLTSAAALRVTLQALLAKTEKKRTTYGSAIAQMCELSLAWLDRAGLFATTPEERRIEINWPNPLPVNELERLTEAEVKSRLGVAKEIVLRELGY